MNETRLRYVIKNNKVWIERYDPSKDLVVNFKALYKGINRKECEIWLKGYKYALKQFRKGK